MFPLCVQLFRLIVQQTVPIAHSCLIVSWAQVLNDPHYPVIHLSSLVFALRLQSLQEDRVDQRLALMERVLDVAL